MYGQYSRAVSNQERVIVARVRQLKPVTVKSRVKRALLIKKSGFWVCLYTRCASKREGLLFQYRETSFDKTHTFFTFFRKYESDPTFFSPFFGNMNFSCYFFSAFMYALKRNMLTYFFSNQEQKVQLIIETGFYLENCHFGCA